MPPNSRILAPTPGNLDRCAKLLAEGALVSVPTETVYGLAGNALREDCIRKIFQVKGRPLIDPLIAHVTDLSAAADYVAANAAAEILAERFWPGPLTLVLPKHPVVPDLLTAGLPSLALRSPRHPVFRELLKRLDFPLAAPSANPFNYISPTRAEHVERTLGAKIAAVLDGGPCEYGIESTIVDLRDPAHPSVLRPGPIAPEDLSAALQREIPLHGPTPPTGAQLAPGALSKHYSPKTTLKLVAHGSVDEARRKQAESDGCALLLNRRPTEWDETGDTFWLSETGQAREIAANLYDLLQRIDQMGYRTIIAELAKDEAIGRSINDRLSRAAAEA